MPSQPVSTGQKVKSRIARRLISVRCATYVTVVGQHGQPNYGQPLVLARLLVYFSLKAGLIGNFTMGR
jgi:hypothetical protein